MDNSQVIEALQLEVAALKAKLDNAPPCDNGCRMEVHDTLNQHSEQVDNLTQRLDTLQDKIDRIGAGVDQLIGIWQASKGFVRVIGWLGVAVKWLAGISIATATVYAVLKHGTPWHK